MSELFAQYEEEFCNYIGSISRKADTISTQSKGKNQRYYSFLEKKEAAITEAQQEVVEAENCLKQMEIELQGLEAQQKIQRETSVKKYKQDLDEVKRTFFVQQERYINQKNKETIMGAQLEEVKVYEGRARLLEQNQHLDSAIQTGYDIENVAVDARVNLQAQTEQMKKVQRNMNDMNQDMRISDRLMNDIFKRRRLNTVIFYGTVSLLLIALILVIVLKLT